MAITSADIVEIAKNDRSLAINAKVAILQAQVDALEQDEFFDRYLHGDTSTNQYIGINDLIWYHYREKKYEAGDTYSSPMVSGLVSWRGWYRGLIEDALASSGDGEFGFYPPDENGAAAQEMDLSAPYLNDNGDTIGDTYLSTSFLGRIFRAKYTVGVRGDTLASITGPGGYATQQEARDAAEVLMYGVDSGEGQQLHPRMGKGVFGRRTSSVEISFSGGGPYNYIIGNDLTIDTPNFFADNTGDANSFLYAEDFKSNLITSLQDIVTFGDTTSSYYNHLESLKQHLTWIFGDSNPYFKEPAMKADMGDTPALVNAILTKLIVVVGHSGDTVTDGDSTVWAYYKFFNVAIGTEINFNTYLERCYAQIYGDTFSLYNTIEDRYLKIDTGDTDGFVGDIFTTDEADFTKERKWRTFWVKQRIGKPAASLINYQGTAFAVTTSNQQLNEKTAALNSVLGNTTAHHLQFIPKTNVLAVYPDPKMTEEGIITKRRISIVYIGQQHTQYYWIYRQTVPAPSASTIVNTAWSNSYFYYKVSTVDPETNLVVTTYTDNDNAFAIGSKYIYRARAFDEIYKVNGDTTASLQSDIFDSTSGKSFTVSGDSSLVLGDSHKFSANAYIVINGTTAKNGYYRITTKGDTFIKISPALTGEASGTAYKCISVTSILV